MRSTLALVVGVVLAFAGLGYLYSNQLTANRALVVENTALRTSVDTLTEAHKRAVVRAKRDDKALVAREQEIAAQARKLAGQEQALQNALQRDNDWSNTNVPPDVQAALAGASSPVPEPVPDGLRDQ